MKAIGLFATPDNLDSLIRYVKLFCGNEAKVAKLGFDHYEKLMTADALWFEQWCEANMVAPEERIICLTTAGMHWNLKAKETKDK